MREQIERHQATVRGADALRERIDTMQVALAAAAQEAEAGAGRAREAAAMAPQCELARDEARTRLDALTHGDTDKDRRRGELEDTRRAGQEAIHEAQRGVERTAEALAQARQASVAFQDEVAASASATTETTRADAVSSDACRDASRAKQASVEAAQRLRDATSDDRVRARELGRAELHNRQLRRQAERAQHGATLGRVAEIKEALAKALATEVSYGTAGAELDAAKQLIEADVTRLSTLDAARSSLVAQERCGQLRQDRAALAVASRTAEDAQHHRDRAVQLRGEAMALRAKVHPAVPSSEVISRLRAQRENLRIAEAQLAVGLSITIRPRRGIALRTSADGAEEISTTIGEPVTLAAKRLLAIRIDELVELEICAGEEKARASLVALQARWEAEAAVFLREHKIDGVEALERLRFDADANVRAAEERDRGAEAADQGAEHLFADAADAPALQARIVELERELGATDRLALETALDQLGPGWPGAIKRLLSDVELERQRAATALEGARQRLARLEAQVEAQGRAAEDGRRDAIAREREREVGLALQQAQAREQEVLVEYQAWKLLAETMKETESAGGAHLGRALAAPVSERFHELTSGRYGRLELGAHLESTGIQAAGELRKIAALSAGTQDQLATLLRICIAEQLRSSIVLDDHLSQSDPERVTWFNAVLRNAAKQIQIVFITCRPSEVLSAAEMPSGGEAGRVVAAGLLRAIDLTLAIRRFGVAPARVAERAALVPSFPSETSRALTELPKA